MHPRIQEVLAHLDQSHAELHRIVLNVPSAMRERSPGEGRWSVAGIIEHLALVEDRVGKSIDNTLQAARANGLGRDTETSPVTPTFDQTLIRDRTQTIVAREGALPTGIDCDSAWALFDKHRSTTRELVIAADGEDLSAVTLQHGRFGLINIYQWLLFLGGHESRHADQVRATAKALVG